MLAYALFRWASVRWATVRWATVRTPSNCYPCLSGEKSMTFYSSLNVCMDQSKLILAPNLLSSLRNVASALRAKSFYLHSQFVSQPVLNHPILIELFVCGTSYLFVSDNVNLLVLKKQLNFKPGLKVN